MARYFGVALRNGLALGLGSIIALGKQATAPTPPPAGNFLLLEDDSFVLLEDDSKIELE
jgi:hypothetical protein